jgi:general secretion pathway protein D
MKAKILLLAVLLTARGLPAQVPPPAATNGLSHEELLRRAAVKNATAPETTAAAIPDWSVTNSPRPANASANVNPPAATPPSVVPPAARVAAALTNARPVTPRPPRPANLPAAPAATIATPPPGPGSVAAPATTPPPAAAPIALSDAGAIALRPPANASNISEPDRIYPPGTIDFPAASLEQILTIYSELVGRNLLRPTSLNMKQDIVLKQTTALTKLEVVQMIEAALYLNQVSVINVGEKFVTVMPTAEAFKIPGIINTNSVTDLPVLGTIITHVVQLKYVKPSEMQAVLQPFASGTAPNPVYPVDSSGILVLRDNVANVKRMLEMIEKVDIVAQSEIISEVIPIKYAKAEEIASALGSVGGGTGGTVGTRASGTTTGSSATGANRMGGLGQPGAYNQPGSTGAMPGANPTPSSNASFGDRVRNLITKAAGAGDFTILGQTKIIADIRSNSLLVFASRQDMEMIKDIISKLDVVLAQVLIETIILDVTFSDSWNLGVSSAQYSKQFSGDGRGFGGINNGNALASTLTNAFPSNLGSGLNYFGILGGNPEWEVAVQAFASDNRVNVIQKPRIQTSHATPASIFIGSTVPYVSGTYYGYGAGTGGSSSYQQLRVGIGLNVTPFINQDGLVVMKIDETIDELDGSTPIANVGNVPNTKSSTLSAEIAVRDKETIILGGIIRNSDTKNKSGVPLLKDIPLLGALFSSRDSSKKRQELIVLMRPTVLRTPEAAALQVDIEKERLPGVRAAEKQLDKVELEKANQEKKKRQTSSEVRPNKSSPSSFDQVTPFTAEDEKLLLTPTP